MQILDAAWNFVRGIIAFLLPYLTSAWNYTLGQIYPMYRLLYNYAALPYWKIGAIILATVFLIGLLYLFAMPFLRFIGGIGSSIVDFFRTFFDNFLVIAGLMALTFGLAWVVNNVKTIPGLP